MMVLSWHNEGQKQTYTAILLLLLAKLLTLHYAVLKTDFSSAFVL